MFDTHMHTRFSSDSEMNIEDAIFSAQQLNMGIIVTEHMDLEYPGKNNAFVFDVEDYFKAYEKYRSENVLLGIEIGLQEGIEEKNRLIVTQNPFDYVIGSIHIVEKIDIYTSEFYRAKTKREVYQRYFTAMIACITKYDDFDSLGHIDYISRYAKYNNTEIEWVDFSEALDELLKILISKGKDMEINTRRLDQKAAIDALMPIYRRYKEHGGRYVTIGSDAHRANEVGRRIEIAQSMAQSLGLSVVYYKNRQRFLDR